MPYGIPPNFGTNIDDLSLLGLYHLSAGCGSYLKMTILVYN